MTWIVEIKIIGKVELWKLEGKKETDRDSSDAWLLQEEKNFTLRTIWRRNECQQYKQMVA